MSKVPSPTKRFPSGLELAIALAAFCTGGVLLSIELAASRVLAPYFGSSLYVWGSLIGVVLAGLSLGYWLGGLLVERFPTSVLLVGLIAAGAIATLIIPLVSDEVLRWVVDIDPGPRADPLLAAVILFGPASVLLAAATPTAVHLSTRSGRGAGVIAGRLFAISTLGSIAGTFATAFWLVPEIGTNELLGILAGVLFAAAVLVAFVNGETAIAAVLAIAAWSCFYWAPSLAPSSSEIQAEAATGNWSPIVRMRGDITIAPKPNYAGLRVLYRTDSRYHRIAVTQDARVRYLRFDNTVQSGMYLRDAFGSPYRYVTYLDLGFAYDPGARDVLMIGLGGGSAQKRIWRDFPKVKLTTVEVDPAVVEIARRYFALPSSPRLDVVTEDGRRYLARDDRRWDVIALDVFYADSIPFHMTTLEFLKLVRERLAPGGVVLMNVIGRIDGNGSSLFRSIYRTYRAVFPTVVVHPVTPARADDRPGLTNIIIVASEKALPAAAQVLNRWRTIRPRSAPQLIQAILSRDDDPISTDGVPILTDDYAPTDALIVVGQ
jgi:spermidine synthase